MAGMPPATGRLSVMEFDVVTIGITGLTLSSLVWRKYRRRTPGLVEQALEANPGLADHLFLPLGMTVRLPGRHRPA